MDISLLKKLGNIDQIAGIREMTLTGGRGTGMRAAEVYNAAGLRYTVLADGGMDLYDLSYRGINLSFMSKNGLTHPAAFNALNGEFAEQWPGGMLVTCGLDNVGGHASEGGIFPTHGRFAFIPAKNFGTEAYWDGDRYLLRVSGEVHQSKMYSRHLSIRRTIETDLAAKTIRIHDVLTNFEAEDEPYMLLYHINFGYPLLDADTCVKVSGSAKTEAMNPISTDPVHMMNPIDGRGEEMYVHEALGKTASGVIYNERLGLGAYVRFGTEHLPRLLEWKNMKSHDYVLALEPCNTRIINRDEAKAAGILDSIPAYSSIENDLTIGILDGVDEIRTFCEAIANE